MTGWGHWVDLGGSLEYTPTPSWFTRTRYRLARFFRRLAVRVEPR